MKKKIFSLAFILYFVGQIFSQEMYISPKIKLKNGIAKEYVFDGNHKLSQLDWQIDNLISIGFDLDVEFKNLCFGFDFSYGLYNFGGQMEDMDWLDYDNPTYLTRYSCHDLLVNEDINFSFNIGSRFAYDKSNRNFGSLFLKLDYQNYLLYGVNGWRYYKDWGDNSYDIFSGKVISYRPSIFSVLIGFGGKFYITKNFSLNFDAAVSMISFGTCKDIHIKANTVFEDLVKGSLYTMGNLSFAYDFSKNSTLLLGGQVANMPLIRGLSYINNTLSLAIGGFSSFFYEFYLSYRIRII